jgi:ATP-binding cassette, subfamily B, bacterial
MTILKIIRSRVFEFNKSSITLIRFLYKYNHSMVIVLFIVSALGALLSMGITYIISYYVNTVIVQTDKISATVLVLSAIIIGLYLVNELFGVLRSYILQGINIYSSKRIQNDVVDLSITADYLDLISKEQKEKYIFVTNISGNCNSTIINGVFMIVYSISTIISSVLIIYSISSWWTIIIALCLVIVSIIVQNNNNRKLMQLFGNTIQENRMMSYITELLIGNATMYETTLFGLHSKLHTEMEYINKEIISKKVKTTKETTKNTMLYRLYYTVLYGIFIITVLFSGKVNNAGNLFLVFTITKAIISSASGIGSSLSSVYMQVPYINKFNEYLLNIKNLSHQSSNKGDFLTNPGDMQTPVINVKHLSFRYYDNSEVLKDVSFSINEGEKVAIVGENGAGKTTLVNILLGLFDSCGSVTVYNVNPYQELMSQSETNNIVAVMQNFGRYKAIKVKDNITFGHEISPEVRNRFAINMEMNESEAEKTLDMNTGNEFNGINFSGGQWQKLALLRGELEHKIVILDEPTASMDPLSEVKILSDFVDNNNNRTKIIITHRLGCTCFVDKIIVLDNGRVVEEGSFEKLINNKGKYYQMYTSQAQLYKI